MSVDLQDILLSEKKKPVASYLYSDTVNIFLKIKSMCFRI